MIVIQNQETQEEILIKNGERYYPPWKAVRSVPDAKIIDSLTDEHKIALGNTAAKILKTIGFKAWWDKKHGGSCRKCQERQAIMNYLKFKGPNWLKNWVDTEEE